MPKKLDTNYLMHRENGFYSKMKTIWERNLAAYAGGRKYISVALIKHLSEIQDEYLERINRAYYFNWPRKIARIITQYVLATRPERENALPELVEDFSRTGLRADEVMRQFSTMLNIYGCAWLCVDMPFFDGVKTKADEIRERLRPYCIPMSPLAVPDWSYGRDGLLDWVVTQEQYHDTTDPFTEPKTITVRKLWTRKELLVIEQHQDGTLRTNVIPHKLGVVPFIRHVEVDGYGIHGNHWMEDVVSISDAILNNESEAQMNTVKQMFGLLVVSESFAYNTVAEIKKREKLKDDDEMPKSVAATIARSAAIIESPDEKGTSRYISPSGVENAVIRTDNTNLVKQMLECIGLTTSKDTRMVESAEAKAWDAQALEQLMKTRADVLEQAERKAWELLNKWNSTITIPKISYNRSFALLDMKEAIAALLELSSFNAMSPEYQKEVGKTAVAMLNRIRQLSQKAQDAIADEIDTASEMQANAGGNEEGAEE